MRWFFDDDEFGPITIIMVLIAVALGATYLPYWIVAQLGIGEGLSRVYDAFGTQSRWLGYPVLALYFVIGFFLQFAIIMAAVHIIAWTAKGLAIVTTWPACIAKALIGMLLWPFRTAGEYLWDLVTGWAALIAQHREEQRELRRLYREEYRDMFRSFRAFKRAWEAMDSDEDPFAEQEDAAQADDAAREEPKVDPYQAALVLLGLTEPFSKAELESRYRTLMKGVHPDTAGPNDLARQVNEARTLIKKRKRWK